MSYQLLNMSLHSKLAFRKFTYIMHYCSLNQNMGCLRVHSKYSLACHWLFYWPGMKEQDMMKNTSVTSMRARTLPSRMPVGLRQMTWVQVIDEYFRCNVILKT